MIIWTCLHSQNSTRWYPFIFYYKIQKEYCDILATFIYYCHNPTTTFDKKMNLNISFSIFLWKHKYCKYQRHCSESLQLQPYHIGYPLKQVHYYNCISSGKYFILTCICKIGKIIDILIHSQPWKKFLSPCFRT